MSTTIEVQLFHMGPFPEAEPNLDSYTLVKEGEATFYDVLVRAINWDSDEFTVLEEIEDIASYDTALSVADKLATKYDTDFEEISA